MIPTEGIKGLLIAALAGLALPFAFSPTEWWPLALLSLAILYQLLLQQSPARSLRIGAVFGLGYFGIGVHWIYHSLHLFGAAIAPLAALLTLIFVCVMAVFPAVSCYAWSRISSANRPIMNALLFSAIWVLAELLRGKLMGGFPWILIGYSQTSGPLGVWAPWVGVYGIGFLVVLLAVLLVVCVNGQRRLQLMAASMALVVVLLTVGLGRVSVSSPLGEPLGVRLVQANIAQEMKFSKQRLQTSLQLYTQMTVDGLDDIDLVVWPETAIPTYFDRVEQALGPFVKSLDARGIDVLAGGFYRDGDDVYNSVRQLGGERALYQKRHLVPFGEFMPLRFILDFAARFIDIPMSDLARGSGPHVPLFLQGTAIGVSICYEDVYGEEMRHLLPAAGVLVNVSNDAWFGNSAAPHQHEQKARMRAREFARPLIRVTNTGVSSSISFDGRVDGRIPHDTAGVLDVQVQARSGQTLYARTGNFPIFIIALLLFAAALLAGRARAKV